MATMQATILNFLRSRSARANRQPPGLDDPLFSTGIIDSFGVLELIAFLEDSFQITIDTARHQLTDFDTVNKIVALVEQKRQPA